MPGLPEASVQIYSRQVRDAKPQAPPEIVATHDILHQAAASGQQDEVQRLLELRCELLKVDSWGRNALHWAAEHGHVGCCNAILRAAESKDVLQQLCTLEDSSSRTPLNAALRAVPQKAQQLARLCIQRADELQVEAKSPRSRDAPQTHTRVKEELKATVKEEAASEQKDVKQELTGVPFQPGERPAYAALSKANEPGRAMRGWASRSRSRSPCPSGSLKPSRKPSLSKPVESSRNQTYGYERPSLRMHTVQLDAETRNKLLKALADQEPRKAKVESEAEPVQARLEELAREATLQREVEEKQKLRVKLEQVLERAQRLEEEQSQTQGECAQLQARLQELQASRAALQHAAENEPLHAELEQAKAKEATRLKKENDDLQVQLQKAQLQVRQLQSQADSLQDTQETLQRSQREKDGLQSELQKVQLQAQQGQKQVDSLKEESERSKKEKDALQAELQKAQLQARQSQSQIDSLQDKVTELQRVQEESARSKKEKDGLQAELQKVELQAQQWQKHIDSLKAPGEATGLYQICFHHPETREPLVPGTPEYALLLPKILAGLPSATRSWLESLLETGRAPGPLPEEPELPKRSDVQACQAKVKELQDAQEALQRSKREKDGLQAELQKALLQAQQGQRQVDSLQEKVAELQGIKEDSARSKKEKDGWQAELKKAQLQARQSQSQIDSLQAKVTELQGVQEESARSKKEKDGLQAELQKVQLQAQQGQRQVDSLQAKVTELQGVQEKSARSKKEKDGLQAELQKVQLQAQQRQRQVDSLQAKVTELQGVQEESARSKKEKDGLQAELQKVQLQAQQRQRQVDSLQAKVTELQGVQEESARSKKEKDGLQAELQKVQLQAQQGQRQVDSLQAKVTELQGVQEESARSKKEKDGLQAELQKVQLQAQQGQRQVDSLQAGEATGLYQICFHHPETREPLVPGTPEYALMLPKILAGLPSATRSWLESLLETGKAPGPLPEEPELPKRSDVRACQADLKRKRQELAQKPAPEDIPGCDETRQLYKICFHDPDTGRPLVKGMPGFATIARTALQHMEGQPQWIQDLLRSLAE
ncbi:unnamed protein product [Effrenium voratum]|nr:unnamed protein product [Effrenium voratum]